MEKEGLQQPRKHLNNKFMPVKVLVWARRSQHHALVQIINSYVQTTPVPMSVVVMQY